jgi:hypothetical protein
MTDWADQTVYLVENDFGPLGRAFGEPNCEYADLDAPITLEGQYSRPVIVAFNTAERWSKDVADDIAHELRRRCDLQQCDVSLVDQDCVDGHEGHHCQLACGWCELCASNAQSHHDWHQRFLSRVHRSGAGDLGREGAGGGPWLHEIKFDGASRVTSLRGRKGFHAA